MDGITYALENMDLTTKEFIKGLSTLNNNEERKLALLCRLLYDLDDTYDLVSSIAANIENLENYGVKERNY